MLRFYAGQSNCTPSYDPLFVFLFGGAVIRSRVRSALVSSLTAAVLLLNACVSLQSDTQRLLAAPRPVFRPPPNGGHVPPVEDVAADRDELLAVLDSLHSQVDASERHSTKVAHMVTIGALVIGAIGAVSPIFSAVESTERKISQAASALTGILAGVGTELQLSKAAEAKRVCKAAIYHSVSDVRLRYSSLTLPTTDSSWSHYIAFKDSVDRNIRANCP